MKKALFFLFISAFSLQAQDQASINEKWKLLNPKNAGSVWIMQQEDIFIADWLTLKGDQRAVGFRLKNDLYFGQVQQGKVSVSVYSMKSEYLEGLNVTWSDTLEESQEIAVTGKEWEGIFPMVLLKNRVKTEGTLIIERTSNLYRCLKVIDNQSVEGIGIVRGDGLFVTWQVTEPPVLIEMLSPRFDRRLVRSIKADELFWNTQRLTREPDHSEGILAKTKRK